MLIKITNENCEIFEYLTQDYEEEFSPLTGKQKQADGKYAIDVHWNFPLNDGFYWKEHGKIIGFVIKDTVEEYSDIGEFYVIPSYRRSGAGRRMAFAIFDLYPGKWQVRQIQGANTAKNFWRNVINQYTKGNYSELILDDPVWGKTTCQQFKS